MIGDTAIGIILALGVVVALGAFVQSVVGFGLAIVSVPGIMLFAPDLMPTAMLVTSFALPAWELVTGEHPAAGRRQRDIAWKPFGFAMGGRIALTPLGVWLVAHASASVIALVVGAMILAAVAASVHAVEVRATAGPALGAGVLTGVSATTAAIGGPFLALVLQHERPSRLRSTMALFFVVGATVSLSGLAIGGQVHGSQVLAGLLWMPFLAVGYFGALRLRGRLHPARLRQCLLVVASVAGVSVIARALVS